MRSILAPLCAMMLVQAMTAMAVVTVPVLAPKIAAALTIDTAAVGFYQSTAFIGAAFLTLMSGSLVLRHGGVRVNQASVVLSAAGVALALTGSVPSRRPRRGACGHGLRARHARGEPRAGADHAAGPARPRVFHQAVCGDARGTRRRRAVPPHRGALRLGVGDPARVLHGGFGGTDHPAATHAARRRPQTRASRAGQCSGPVRPPGPHHPAAAADRAGGVQLRRDAVVAVRVPGHLPGRAGRTGPRDGGAAVRGNAGSGLRRPGRLGLGDRPLDRRAAAARCAGGRHHREHGRGDRVLRRVASRGTGRGLRRARPDRGRMGTASIWPRSPVRCPPTRSVRPREAS